MRRTHLSLLILFAVPFFVGLDDSSVWDSNEAYYVQTPREMLERGDWITPYFNGRPRVNKPPLSYWLVGAFYRLFGPDLLWQRLTMALLAAATLGAVYKIGATLFDHRVALLAAGIWATTFRLLMLSRRLLIDIVLLFCVLMALAFLIDWLRGGRGRALLAGAAFVGLGFLAKGPLGLFPALVLIAHLAATRKLKRLAEAPWGWAVLLIAAIAAPWFVVLGAREGWGAPLSFILRENLARFAGHESFQKGWPNPPSRGIFYYFGVFAVDFFPWSLFFLTAAVWAIFARSKDEPDKGGERGLLWIWMAAWFAVFSLSSNKQEYYILPMYPAAAVWTASRLRGRAPFWIPAAAAGAGLTLAAALLLWIAGALFPESWWVWLPPPFLVLFAWPALKGRWLAAVACLSLFFAFAFGVYLEPLERYRPVRHFAETIRRLESQSKTPVEAGYFGFASPSLTFYLNRPIHELQRLEEAAALLDGPDRVVLIVDDSSLRRMRETVATALRVIETRAVFATNSRSLWAALRSGQALQSSALTKPVHLISNRAN